jgi:hypothetical protein
VHGKGFKFHDGLGYKKHSALSNQPFGIFGQHWRVLLTTEARR